ncbi:amino acid ABC transporter ATP-binding protein [Candidatus Babeliales bacterium]|nr:amino acid ABC transporter ATP-binding protein [Candidatus Babeliales bacterium]
MITIKNLYKKFNNKVILHNINFSINSGECVALLGKSGSGKSTLLKILAGLIKPTSGKIQTNSKIGMVMQDFQLFPHMTVIENITYTPIHVLKTEKMLAQKQAYELLKNVEMENYADTYPQKLSGGQKQRVAIARTLAANSEIILFDEPTSSLDQKASNDVAQIIKDLTKKDITIVIVTHEKKLAEAVANQVIFLENAKIIEGI